MPTGPTTHIHCPEHRDFIGNWTCDPEECPACQALMYASLTSEVCQESEDSDMNTAHANF